MKKIQIFSTPTCAYCVMAKEWFKENDIKYEEFDVSVDEEKRNELIEKTGQMAVPVIIVSKETEGEEEAKEEIVIGFDKARLAELLEVK